MPKRPGEDAECDGYTKKIKVAADVLGELVEVKDAVTNENLDDPYILPCGHTFNFKTLNRVKEMEVHPKCPTCRRGFDVLEAVPNLQVRSIFQEIILPSLPAEEKTEYELRKLLSSLPLKTHSQVDFSGIGTRLNNLKAPGIEKLIEALEAIEIALDKCSGAHLMARHDESLLNLYTDLVREVGNKAFSKNSICDSAVDYRDLIAESLSLRANMRELFSSDDDDDEGNDNV